MAAQHCFGQVPHGVVAEIVAPVRNHKPRCCLRPAFPTPPTQCRFLALARRDSLSVAPFFEAETRLETSRVVDLPLPPPTERRCCCSSERQSAGGLCQGQALDSVVRPRRQARQPEVLG